jgi:hypothetical protein
VSHLIKFLANCSLCTATPGGPGCCGLLRGLPGRGGWAGPPQPPPGGAGQGQAGAGLQQSRHQATHGAEGGAGPGRPLSPRGHPARYIAHCTVLYNE